MVYVFGEYVLDTEGCELRCAGKPIHLGLKAYQVLVYLVEQRHRLVAKEELLEEIWPETYVHDSAGARCIRILRQAVGDRRDTQSVIQTLHGKGYRFVAEVTEHQIRLDDEPVDAATVQSPEASLQNPVTPVLPAHRVAEQVSQEWLPPPFDTSSTPPIAFEAQRRQLTVLHCTLIESIALAGQLELETYYDVVHAYQAICDESAQRYGGHLASYTGDGVWVYFGYPLAHEDDAQRAIYAGLDIIELLHPLRSRVAQELGARLGVRLSIHTGQVIVDRIGSAQPQQLALGETSHIAARLQSLAAPDTVVISEATAKLVDGYFAFKVLSDAVLTGQNEPSLAYEVLGECVAQTRLDVEMARGLTSFVGREAELALLRDRWAYVQEGMGQVVMLRGEAGIGKSRLVQVFKEQVIHEQPHLIESRCSPYHQHTALYPMIELMQRVLQARSAASGNDKIETLEALLARYPFPLHESVPLLATLLSLPLSNPRFAPLNWTPQRQREQTFDVLSTWLVAQALESPMLFIVEDLHWADPSTLEFLQRLLGQVPTTSMMVVLICRSMFETPWSNPTWMTPLTLNRLTRPHMHQMITQVAGGETFSAEVMEQLVEKTDGVPLFVEELIRTVLQTGQFEKTDMGYEFVGELSQLSIPSTLHDSLMARLDRLGAAKEIAQWGAVLGREFTYELIEKVTPHDELVLQAGLDRLVASELVFHGGLAIQPRYRFKHALVQDVAYESLRRPMRQACHQRIAEALAAQFPETAESQPELLAHHYTEAGENEAAVDYWQRAGERALQRSANQEAIAHLRQGLDLLTRVLATPARRQRELDLQVALARALMTIKGQGVPDVEHAYTRAWELCQQIGDTPQHFPVLRGLMLCYQAKGQVQTAHRLGEQLLRLAQSQNDPSRLLLAHYQLGLILFYLGEPISAHIHHTQTLAVYTLQEYRFLADDYGLDLSVTSHSWLSWELWQLGYPDQALQHSQAARTLAEEMLHPYSLAQVVAWEAVLHQYRREVLAAHEQATTAVALATEQGLAQRLARGKVIQGWALAMQGQSEAGIAQIGQGLAASLATGAKMLQLYALGLLAEAYGKGGRPDEGLPLLDEAVAVIDATEARFYEAEIYRLKGTLLLQLAVPDVSRAEACFHQALDIARQQEAKTWELCAATSLARLWQQQNKGVEAYELLAPVYEWFTEGFDTADLIDARELLDALQKGR